MHNVRPRQMMRNHGRWCTTMADDAQPWQMMLDCVSVNTQLCDYRPSCRIQNDYFKIKYTLLMGMSVCCWLSDSMVGCRVPIVNCGLSDSRQIQLTIRAQMVRLSDCFMGRGSTVRQSDSQQSDSRTVRQTVDSWLRVGRLIVRLSDCR